jgi:hypothetical protein
MLWGDEMEAYYKILNQIFQHIEIIIGRKFPQKIKSLILLGAIAIACYVTISVYQNRNNLLYCFNKDTNNFIFYACNDKQNIKDIKIYLNNDMKSNPIVANEGYFYLSDDILSQVKDNKLPAIITAEYYSNNKNYKDESKIIMEFSGQFPKSMIFIKRIKRIKLPS